MGKISKSILDAISSSIPDKDKVSVTENRASHSMASAINLLHFLKENYSAEEAEELTKRFLNAIRTESPDKFYRGLKKLKEQNQVVNGDTKIIIESEDAE